jgi:hypothetical protein
VIRISNPKLVKYAKSNVSAAMEWAEEEIRRAGSTESQQLDRSSVALVVFSFSEVRE